MSGGIEKNEESLDRGTKNLQRLQFSQRVRVQVEPSATWRRATVKKPKCTNSYIIEVEGGTYQRNQRHIRKTYEDNMPEQSELEDLIL